VASVAAVRLPPVARPAPGPVRVMRRKPWGGDADVWWLLLSAIGIVLIVRACT